MRTNPIIYLRGLKPLLEGRKINYAASQIGIDDNTLYQLSNCTRGASLAMALRIANYFGRTVEEIVGETQTATV